VDVRMSPGYPAIVGVGAAVVPRLICYQL